MTFFLAFLTKSKLLFFGVVVVMSGSLNWGAIFAGFIPNFSLLSEPASKFTEIIRESSDPGYWNDIILSSQRDRMVTAAATAVGINMTFLLPYSMLRKGWGREHRGLATFDLSLGLFLRVFRLDLLLQALKKQGHGLFKKTAQHLKLQVKFILTLKKDLYELKQSPTLIL